MAHVKYAADTVPVDAGGGAERRVLAYDGNLMAVRVAFPSGGVGSTHSHPHAQCSYVVSGRFVYTVNGQEHTLKPGDSVVVAPHEVHSARCLEEGVLLDVFTPMREDFLG